MRDIGKNIRDLRERAKLTQDALAEQLCTTRQTISNYERGKTRPDVEQILRLAAIFGTDANAILYGPPGAERRRDARLRTVLSGMIWGVLQTGCRGAASSISECNAEGASVAFASSRNASCVRLVPDAAHFAGDCAQAAEDKAGCPCADHSYHSCWAFNRTAITVLRGGDAVP